MKAKPLEVFDHDTDVDTTHKNNSIELDHWINHLSSIKKELFNLVELCSADLNLGKAENDVLKRLQKKEDENENLLNAMLSYSTSRTNIIECEDTQCDIFYIAEHETYRSSYDYQIDKYQGLKDRFFKEEHGKISLIEVPKK
ncbi:hypothetical protein ESY86_04130 [Subsaximicrobium wynnwilliamsii]|uniref:Uncharacterized protein n=1 Tax=Subsaximicrobium wynnwilliamsii TaxID=291179 RepID=A0A5C6ZK28_9FLAO|nr:hypothetical protein [Subsaximicrobium wynnwilliamsii]TXD84893.1 hypothetical protein ESY87_03910 [Subsaximicrobium wynnwilliamsii]TXD90564.1 hypothetical protein ESY86_04130 [Subsaximicrobium wynnwilliamsii]TXE05039.1 hypothetical protein ESY88_02435 [Subsaximicrobium wynnwilliamsii]